MRDWRLGTRLFFLTAVSNYQSPISSLGGRLKAGHLALNQAVVVRVHPSQLFMVAVAQSAERPVVARKVVGSIPTSHPTRAGEFGLPYPPQVALREQRTANAGAPSRLIFARV